MATCETTTNILDVGTFGHCGTVMFPVAAEISGIYQARWYYRGSLVIASVQGQAGTQLSMSAQCFNESSVNEVTLYNPSGVQIGYMADNGSGGFNSIDKFKVTIVLSTDAPCDLPDDHIATPLLIPGPYVDHADAFANGVQMNAPYRIILGNRYGYPSPEGMAVIAQVQFGDTSETSLPGPYADHAEAFAAGVQRNELYMINQENQYGYPSIGNMGVVAQVEFGSITAASAAGPFSNKVTAQQLGLFAGNPFLIIQENEYGYPSPDDMGVLAVA